MLINATIAVMKLIKTVKFMFLLTSLLLLLFP